MIIVKFFANKFLRMAIYSPLDETLLISYLKVGRKPMKAPIILPQKFSQYKIAIQ